MGHKLKVKDRYAGKTGLCPRCGSRVRVPGVSEQEILRLLACDGLIEADHPEPAAVLPGAEAAETRPVRLPLTSGSKACPRCKKDVRAGFDLCPYCGTYFAGPAEVLRRLKAG
jgi:RNA polymerase subunit RPABC4/transcription elongation factor Spt4